MTDLLATPRRIDPCRLEAFPDEIVDLVTAIASESARLERQLAPQLATALAGLVAISEVYFAGMLRSCALVPNDIAQGVNAQFSDDPACRLVQLQAAGHADTQRKISAAGADEAFNPVSVETVAWLHRTFHESVAASAVAIGKEMPAPIPAPGIFRNSSTQDAAVERPHAPSGGRVEAFMTHFEQSFPWTAARMGMRIASIPGAHHRFSYIHPFPDGNEAVAQLMSYAMIQSSGISAGGLWSLCRGLALSRDGRGDYRQMMAHADTPRQGVLDGKGNLSLRALVEFTVWFLSVCLEQIRFMAALFDPSALERRLGGYVEEAAHLRPQATTVLIHVLHNGEMPRGDMEAVSGLKERTARDLLSALVEDGILGSTTPKTPVSLQFPMRVAENLFPRLFAG